MKIIYTFLLVGISFSSFSQSIDNQVISAAGNQFETNGGALSGTLGEPISTTLENNDLMLTQGFHQPTYVLTSILEHNNKDIDLTIFPNPTADFVQIRTSRRGIKYNIVDMNGKLLSKGTFKENIVKLDLTQYANGIFLINIYSKNHNFSKTYQVVKK